MRSKICFHQNVCLDGDCGCSLEFIGFNMDPLFASKRPYVPYLHVMLVTHMDILFAFSLGLIFVFIVLGLLSCLIFLVLLLLTHLDDIFCTQYLWNTFMYVELKVSFSIMIQVLMNFWIMSNLKSQCMWLSVILRFKLFSPF